MPEKVYVDKPSTKEDWGSWAPGRQYKHVRTAHPEPGNTYNEGEIIYYDWTITGPYWKFLGKVEEDPEGVLSCRRQS